VSVAIPTLHTQRLILRAPQTDDFSTYHVSLRMHKRPAFMADR